MFGHLMRLHKPFITNIFEGRNIGRKGRGRPWKAYIEEITRRADCNRYVNTKRPAFNSEEWRTRFATTRLGL